MEFIPLASPYRTEPYRTEPFRTVPNRTEPPFFKNTSNFKSDVFPHRCIQRYIEKYAVSLDSNGKYDGMNTVQCR